MDRTYSIHTLSGAQQQATGKVCSVCKRELARSAFSNRKNACDGLQSECKECSRRKRLAKQALWARERRADYAKQVGKEVPEEKRCCTCGVVKAKTEFPKNRCTLDGLASRCCACQSAYAKAYYSKRCADDATYDTARLLRKLIRKAATYGISEADYLVRSIGPCEICGTMGRQDRRHSLDHDHATGLFRGFLCDTCNNGIARFRDDIDLLARAIAYLTGQRTQE
jgi:hypothetical protein